MVLLIITTGLCLFSFVVSDRLSVIIVLIATYKEGSHLLFSLYLLHAYKKMSFSFMRICMNCCCSVGGLALTAWQESVLIWCTLFMTKYVDTSELSYWRGMRCSLQESAGCSAVGCERRCFQPSGTLLGGPRLLRVGEASGGYSCMLSPSRLFALE